ncbi:MAG: ATP-binding cassette domain-containing protein, partial [Proteobacteria bacterium]|nr:ATP-binding cassette domain-containing protein [Pseudomonadota bacterium]
MSADTLPIAFEGVAFDAGGRRLLGPLDLAFEAGPLTVVMGPNGAGKSLLLRLAHGLLVPSAGRIRCGALSGAEATRRQAMVFERSVLLRRSVAANVRYALGLRGVPRAERPARAAAALARGG